MRNTSLLLLGALFAPALASAKAPAEPLFQDKGVDFSTDAYDYEENDAWSDPPLEGLREVYVDADAYLRSLTPAAPPDVPEVVLPEPPPEDLLERVHVVLPPERLDGKKLTFDDVVAAIEAEGLEISKVDAEDHLLCFLITGEEDGAAQALVAQLGTIVVGKGRRKADIGDVAASIEVAPAPVTTRPIPKPDIPEKGNLVIVNPASGWAELSINGTKVGVLGPLATAKLHDVKHGQYDVQLSITTGLTWTDRVESEPK